jgi:predicted AAA+ superfamily ATPase
MVYRHRVLETRLKKHLGLFPAVAVTGPRQSGKSTLLRMALPDFPYVSFDDPEEVRAAEVDPRGYLSRFPDRVILDEVQRAPGLFSYLKLAIDEDRQRRGRFVLSGSNQFSLSSRLSESLAGRIGLLELHPFERSEMPRAAQAAQMFLGSYPELTMRGHEGAREWYSSYLATYLERDVRLANEVGKLSDFQTLVRLLAIRTSQEYNASALARDVGVSSKTIESWVSILEARKKTREKAQAFFLGHRPRLPSLGHPQRGGPGGRSPRRPRAGEPRDRGNPEGNGAPGTRRGSPLFQGIKWAGN